MTTTAIKETKIEGENIESLIEDDRPIKWLIEGMLPQGHRGMIANCEGGCKTTLLCWIAVCVATGRDVFGMKIEQGSVLMIDEETPRQSLERKLYRFCLSLGIKSRYKLPNLVIKSMTGYRFARANTKMLTLIKSTKPALITIDTLVACLPSGRQGKGENNAETGIAIKDGMMSHGFTYSGHPIAAAACSAALDIYMRDNIVENAATVGDHIKQRLEAEFVPLPCVGYADGRGVFQALELVKDKKTKEPIDRQTKEKFWQDLFDAGIFTRIIGWLGNRMFICPPCTITIEEADRALDIIKPLVAGLESK